MFRLSRQILSKRIKLVKKQSTPLGRHDSEAPAVTPKELAAEALAKQSIQEKRVQAAKDSQKLVEKDFSDFTEEAKNKKVEKSKEDGDNNNKKERPVSPAKVLLESWRTVVDESIELKADGSGYRNKTTGEQDGPKGLEPTRFGDWEQKGRISDF